MAHATYVGVWVLLAVAIWVTFGFMVREAVLAYRDLRAIKRKSGR
jgi:hypothetical protein